MRRGPRYSTRKTVRQAIWGPDWGSIGDGERDWRGQIKNYLGL